MYLHPTVGNNIAAGWQPRRVGVAFVRAASPVCGEDKLPFWGTVSSVCGEDVSFALVFSMNHTVSSVCGEDPSRNAIRFPVTKVPVSPTVAPHSRVLCSLHGRMGSDKSLPYRF